MNNINSNPLFLGIIALILVYCLKDTVPYLGKMPGDIEYQSGNIHFYFPITSMLCISVILSFLTKLIK